MRDQPERGILAKYDNSIMMIGTDVSCWVYDGIDSSIIGARFGLMIRSTPRLMTIDNVVQTDRIRADRISDRHALGGHANRFDLRIMDKRSTSQKAKLARSEVPVPALSDRAGGGSVLFLFRCI